MLLKRILGQAPFDIDIDRRVVITPGKKTKVLLLFSNDSEYDLPLSVKLCFDISVQVDKTAFDITVPAGGNTQCSLVFSKDTDAEMFTGRGIAELETVDRIFDSKTFYEFEILCEAAYKCEDEPLGFSPSEQILFTNGGVFFANRGETAFVEIPLMENAEYRLGVLSGSIKDKKDGDILKLSKGLNRLCFEMLEDGSFTFLNISNDEPVYPDTLNTKNFI